MTVTAGTRSETAGNGTTTAFTATFRANSAAEVGVALQNDTTGAVTAQTITTHYTVALDATTRQPTVTFLTAPASGNTVVIYPNATIKQEEDLSANAPLYGTSIEAALDKLAAQLQTLSDIVLNDCLRGERGGVGIADIGDAADRASTALGFDAGGDPSLT